MLEKGHRAQRQGQPTQELLARRLLEDFRTYASEGLEDIPLADIAEISLAPQPEPNHSLSQDMSASEICVYDALLSRPEQIVPYGELTGECLTERGDKAALFSTVARLRRKVPEPILDVRSKGYVISTTTFSLEKSA